jgi:hypothetical protein
VGLLALSAYVVWQGRTRVALDNLLFPRRETDADPVPDPDLDLDLDPDRDPSDDDQHSGV